MYPSSLLSDNVLLQAYVLILLSSLYPTQSNLGWTVGHFILRVDHYYAQAATNEPHPNFLNADKKRLVLGTSVCPNFCGACTRPGGELGVGSIEI
jgi:hypothetical protein